MKVTSETLPERQVRLQIEVDDERHAEALEQAYRKLAPRVTIRGFRPGKAPRPLIEKQLGKHRLLDEAMDIVVPEAYKEAIEKEDLDPVGTPQVELVSHEPLVFTATVPLTPTIDLGDYLNLRLPKEEPKVTDEQVEESITELRRRYGTIEPVTRAAKKGDIIRGSLRAEVDDGVLFEQNDIEYRLTDESLGQLPGLAEALVGLKKGADVEKTHAAPEDFADPRIAGKTITYKIQIEDVKEEKMAANDDSFAKEVGEGFESLEALKQRIRDDIQKGLDDNALRSYENAVVDALTDAAKLEYPPVLVDREVDHILEDQAGLDPRDERAVQLYIERMGKTEEEVREGVKEQAEQRLRRSLVLSQFAEAENIEVEESDIEEELQTMAASAGEQSETILRLFGTDNGRDTLRRSLLTRKTLARLIEIAGADGAKAKAAPAAKKRRATPRKAETEETTAEAAAEDQEKK